VDSYLRLAQQVLREARRPLGPRAILTAAYLSEVVPPNLYGKTQHKTLQARLSEDILLNRERSAFFRCAPGKFFLREFMHDISLPVEFRTPIVARRRLRDLKAQAALAFKVDDLRAFTTSGNALKSDAVYGLIEDGRHSYVDPKEPPVDHAMVWSFVVVLRSLDVLTYRLGRYREERDAFFNRRSLGFFTLISQHDSSLFDVVDAGISSTGLRAAKMDLDILFDTPNDCVLGQRTSATRFVYVNQSCETPPSLLSIVPFVCPAWFEPTKRRLAINDLSWMSIVAPPNNLDDFEPWSRCIAGNVRAIAAEHAGTE
jgi:hypothetical protein